MAPTRHPSPATAGLSGTGRSAPTPEIDRTDSSSSDTRQNVSNSNITKPVSLDANAPSGANPSVSSDTQYRGGLMATACNPSPPLAWGDTDTNPIAPPSPPSPSLMETTMATLRRWENARAARYAGRFRPPARALPTKRLARALARNPLGHRPKIPAAADATDPAAIITERNQWFTTCGGRDLRVAAHPGKKPTPPYYHPFWRETAWWQSGRTVTDAISAGLPLNHNQRPRRLLASKDDPNGAGTGRWVRWAAQGDQWMEATLYTGTAKPVAHPLVRQANRAYAIAEPMTHPHRTWPTRCLNRGRRVWATVQRVVARGAAARPTACQGSFRLSEPGRMLLPDQQYTVYVVLSRWSAHDGAYTGITAEEGGGLARHVKRVAKVFGAGSGAMTLSPFEQYVRSLGRAAAQTDLYIVAVEHLPPLADEALQRWRRRRSSAEGALSTAPMSALEWREYAHPFEKFWVHELHTELHRGGFNVEHTRAARVTGSEAFAQGQRHTGSHAYPRPPPKRSNGPAVARGRATRAARGGARRLGDDDGDPSSATGQSAPKASVAAEAAVVCPEAL